jgi:multiple sugar transport system permease protein
MMLPALLLLALMSLAPFVYIIWMSFQHVSLLGGQGIRSSWGGLSNWTRMFSDGEVGAGWLAMLVYFVCTVGLELVLGVAIALAIHALVWGKNLVLTLVLIPMFIAPVIVGLLGRFMVNDTYGLYSWILDKTHIYRGSIFGHTVPAFASVVLMDVWEWTPLIALITLAGLTSMNPTMIEAASVDGAGYLQRLRHIVLPTISGIVVVALIIRSMDAMRYFDIVWISTTGGPGNGTKIIPMRLYEVAFRFLNLGYAAAIGLAMLAVSILLANVFLIVLRRSGATT